MSCLLAQRVYVVSSQLVCGRVGCVQPELWRWGANATGPVCPENQPDQCSQPGRLSLYPAHPSKEASLQRTQLSTSLDHWAMVRGMFVKMISHHQGRALWMCSHRYKSVQQLLLCIAGKSTVSHTCHWAWSDPSTIFYDSEIRGFIPWIFFHRDLPCLGLWPVSIHCVGWLLYFFKSPSFQ